MTTLKQLKEGLIDKVKDASKNVARTLTNPIAQADRESSGKKFWTKPLGKPASVEKMKSAAKIKESYEGLNALLSQHKLKVHSVTPSSSGKTLVNIIGKMDVEGQQKANKTLQDAGYQNHKVVHAPQKLGASEEFGAGKKMQAGRFAGD